MAKSGQKNKEVAPRNVRVYGGWNFAKDFSKGIFQLLNSGKIYPAFGLVILVIIGIVAFRLPEAHLATTVSEFFSTLQSLFGLSLGALVASNLGWAWLFRRQTKLLEDEIERISIMRSELLHTPNRIQITNHRSSDSPVTEAHILPEALAKPKNDKS
jgi:hypothetical protein